ncbi:MAG: dihydroxyacetone kinase phosphoryl donor subunit DhaM [Anaerolineaceae bacterium]|nr:dihydroxyacetone kinase phosphoryl donor subunit DhaM [Anaerolineaceae bacterium]
MVSILLVSHSYQLAQGTAELVRQMASSADLKIRVAAGIGDEHEEIGTNAIEIMEALSELTEDGDVLVLMDLGSAVLSTEMALQMLDEEIAGKVRMCPAPFVEGAIAAGVQANMGSPIQEVYDEAMNALAAKQQQIVGDVEVQTPAEPKSFETPALAEQVEDKTEVLVTVTNPTGLHARPASTFIQTVKKHDASLTVTNRTTGAEPVLVKGMISVMLLAAKQGDELLLQATGPDRTALLAELEQLFLDNFGE